MKTLKFTFLLSFFIGTLSFAQDWQMIFEDEFSGSSLNSSNWTHETGTGSQYGLWGWGNGESQYYQSSNTVVSNGTAKIIAKRQNVGGMNYTSSRIKTNGKFTFRYGKVQARMKTVEGQGFWPAFWLLPSGGGWPCDGEIDIMEQWAGNGDQIVTTGAAHVGTCPGGSTYKSFGHNSSSGSYADDFHIYEVRWYPDYIAWYVDNQKVYQITPSDFPNNNWPFNENNWYIILNLAITGDGPNGNTQFPSQIEIDWVRVYQPSDGNYGGHVDISGCLDSNASNYNANANDQAFDQWGNALCTYTSCANAPSEGCMYSDAFAAWHENFNANDCSSYGGTPCQGSNSDVLGCTDPKASDYNPNATAQSYDQWDNILCVYTTCNDVPANGCRYPDAFAEWHDNFNANDCVNYGGIACEGSGGGNTGGNTGGEGCIDANASNYDASASTQSFDQYGNLKCIYNSCNDIPEPGCIYSDGFGIFNPEFDATACSGYGGTPCDGSGSGNTGGNTVVEGCLDANASNYNASATDQSFDQYGNSTCIYASCNDIPDSEGCSYPDGYSPYNEYFTPENCTSYGGTACDGSGGGNTGGNTGGNSNIEGCIDANASNYNASATVQNYDQWDNILCVYTTCNDVPANGCRYPDAFAEWHENFNANDCVNYGGIACEGSGSGNTGGNTGGEGCIDANASNYDASANTQSFDQYGNLKCIYNSCNDIPEPGCIYSDGFGIFNPEFDATACSGYGGTPCDGSGSGNTGGNNNGGSNTGSTTYCETTVTHFNIEAEVASTIVLSISNVDANTVTVSATSANDDAIDVLIVGAQTHVAAVSATTFEGGKASLNLTWADGAPASTSFEVLWSKESMGGNWMLSQNDLASINTANACSGNDGGNDGGEPSSDVEGCLDANADNYNASATVQGLDQYGNLACNYSSCNDIPDAEGCYYAENYSAFHDQFNAANCEQYGGTPCVGPSDGVEGCLDANATNYNASATVQALDQYGNLVCVFASCDDIPDTEGCIYTDGYSAYNEYFTPENCTSYGGTACVAGNSDNNGGGQEPVTDVNGVVFSGTFGGTIANANVYTNPSGSESWAGFANEDASIYPLTFADGGSITFDASSNASASIYFRFEKNPHPDTEPSFNTDPVTVNGSGSYTVNVPSQGSNTFKSFLLYVTTPNVEVTLDNVTVSTSGEPSSDVEGCLDANADNYNANATVQGLDQYGNLACNYSSCNDIPDAEGCFYTENYSAFKEGFSAADCVTYGGTACEGGPTEIPGCTNPNATNYNPNATQDDNSCQTSACGPDWNVTVTDNNHSIFINGTWTDANGEPMVEGSVIGVFYQDNNGALKSAGWAEYSDGTVQIAAMGDDASTTEKDGLAADESFVYRVWDANLCEEFPATVTYSGGVETYTGNGITFISSINANGSGPTEQTLNLVKGWSIFSTYIIPDEKDLGTILSPIIENVIIAKDYTGAAYLPEYNFNGIGDVTLGQGYQIKTTEASDLTISGTYATPEQNPISYTEGWNMIGYLRTEAAPCDAVLADMVDKLIIAKNSSGAAYLPEWDFNGIGMMNPGEGYQIKTTAAGTLQFHSNDDDYRYSSLKAIENHSTHFPTVMPTDHNMTVLIEDQAWNQLPKKGAEIAAYDAMGTLIGSSAYTSPLSVIALWGDDATTVKKDGLIQKEPVSYKIWQDGQVNDFHVTEWSEGSNGYQTNAIHIASIIETNQPLTEMNSSEAKLIRIINMLGQEINDETNTFEGSVLFYIYNDGQVKKVVK
jgi:beta-glucanase (GH16 family)